MLLTWGDQGWTPGRGLQKPQKKLPAGVALPAEFSVDAKALRWACMGSTVRSPVWLEQTGLEAGQ